MKRAIDIARFILLVLSAVFLVALTLAVLNLDSEIHEISDRVKTFLDSGIVLSENVDDRVNELHMVVAHADKVLLQAAPIEEAALARVNELQPVEQQAVDVEKAALARVNQLQVPITDAGKVLTDTRVAVSNANKAAIDERFYFEQQIPPAMTKLDAVIDGLLPVEQNLASMAAHGDAVMGDVQVETDKIAHPPKKKLGFWGSVYAGAQVVHKLSPPLF